MKKRYTKLVSLAVGSTVMLGLSTSAVAGSMTSSPGNLQEIVNRQQEQLDAQASQIAELKEQLNALLGHTEQNKKAIATKVDKEEIEKLKVDKMVTSKNPNVDVVLYGQVNRAGLWADNGNSSKVYFVDNDNSSTRMGLTANAKVTDDFSIGGKIEYEIESNSSSAVNELEENTSADLKVRHTDVWFDSQKYGRLYIGRGSTATDGTSEVDLSGTSIVTYSSIVDMAGGQLWYNSSTNSLSSITIGDVYSNMDGLSRADRFRYDTPSMAGLTFSAGAVETGAFDFAGRYSRKYDGLTVGAALGYATPGDLKSWDNQINGSVSVLLDMGLNFTLAGGQQDFDLSDRDDPTFWYGKIGYKTQWFSCGTSALSIDYGMSNDQEANGDETKTFGIAFVQSVSDWGTELYLAYRHHAYDQENNEFDNINAVMSGARIKF